MAQWDDVKRNLGDWSRNAATKTNQAARIGVRKIDVLSLTRQRRRHLRELGEYVLVSVREGRLLEAEDPGLQNMIAAVEDVEAALAAKGEEIESIRSEPAPKTSEPPAEEAAPEESAHDIEDAEIEDIEPADTAEDGDPTDPQT